MNKEKISADITKDNNSKAEDKQFSEKETAFLEGLDESVKFVNNYKASNLETPSLKRLLDEF